MTVECSTAYIDSGNDYTVRGDAPPAVTLSELALCTDANFTEATDPAYERADLTADASTSTAGEITDSFPFDVGSQTVSHWMIVHDDVWVVRGALQTPFTGANTVDLRALLRGSSTL